MNKERTIVLVDDLPFMRRRMLEILTPAGYRIAGEASNGLEGVKLYKKLKPDLVLLDITMPKMDGLTALRHLKKYDSHAKVIMCSSLGEEKYIIKAILYGAQDFIVKPFSEIRLLEAVGKAFEI